MIGGEEDLLMTPADVKNLYALAWPPKELWMVPGAKHAKCREAAGAEYDRRVLAFFNAHR